jgi:hypothetical protein
MKWTLAMVLAVLVTGDPAREAAAATSSQPVAPRVFSGDLRRLPVANDTPEAGSERLRVLAPARASARAAPSRPPAPDPLLALQRSAPAASGTFSPLLVDIDGIPYGGTWPPDPVGDVGPGHYIQMTNHAKGSRFAVYDKAGRLLAGPSILRRLADPDSFCVFAAGDPIVVYDEAADRWLMSETATFVVGTALCVYVSRTPDPVTGGWLLYEFLTPSFPDFAKLAVWSDAYYVTSNEAFGPTVYALERDAMLAGVPARILRTVAPRLAGFRFQALTPADLDGQAPAPGAPGWFLRHVDDEAHEPPGVPGTDRLEIFWLVPDFDHPESVELQGPLAIPVSEFDSDLCGLEVFACFRQPDTFTLLDSLREVVMWRAQYRNFGTYETLVGNFVTDVSGADQGGVRWFELRKTGAADWTLFQEGTYAPDTANRWLGSNALDADGNMVLGFTAGADTLFPSIRYTGRLADDPPGLMTLGERSLMEGLGSQLLTSRWGDYSSLNVDPVDGCTFWYTSQYMPFTTNFEWRTRIGAFRIDSCGNQPPAAVAHANSPVECTGPEGAPVLLDGSGSSDPDSSEGTNDDIVAFDWFRDLGGPAETPLGSGERLLAPLPLGTHSVNLRVTDGEGATDTDTIRIDVVDTTPPELQVALHPRVLFPATGRLVKVRARVKTRDRCGEAAFELTALASNQPATDADDILGAELGTPDTAFRLRARRSDRKANRVYTAVYRAADPSGNETSASAETTVLRLRSVLRRLLHWLFG